VSKRVKLETRVFEDERALFFRYAMRNGWRSPYLMLQRWVSECARLQIQHERDHPVEPLPPAPSLGNESSW